MSEKKKILFGAGKNGLIALHQYGYKHVAYFCDNSLEKKDKLIEGIKVISFKELIDIYNSSYEIVITPTNCFAMVAQLEHEGIYDYSFFEDQDFSVIDEGKKIENQCCEDNRILNEYAKKTDQIDIFNDVASFQELASDLNNWSKRNTKFLAIRGYNEEGQFYGNLYNLMRYAELEDDSRLFFPLVSHQDCFPLFSVGFQYRSAVVFPGEYFKMQIHKRFPYVPVFSVGPYIHYAQSIYDNNTIERIKRENGKTLLVYMPHSIESVKRNYSKNDFIDEIKTKYSDIFQTIYLCVYWADINDPVCEYAQKKGLHIVCAGFRFDTKFNSRQKTMLELCDAVAFADIGTFVSYALFMNKPVARLGISDDTTISEKEFTKEFERTLQFNDEYREYCHQFYKIFDDEIKLDRHMYEWSNGLCGYDQIKDKEYIKCMFEISKDIMLCCGGYLDKYQSSVVDVMNQYKKRGDDKKYEILKNSIQI